MPGPLKIIKTQSRDPEGHSPNSDTYTVYLTLNRSLTTYERDLINSGTVTRPLGIGGADPSNLPKTLLISRTTIEQVAAASDEIKEFLALLDSEGMAAQLEAQNKADQKAASNAEAQRRQAIADKINWD